MEITINNKKINEGQLTLLAGTDHIQVTPIETFNGLVCQFLEALSKKLLKFKAYPEVMALGYWCRKSHIMTLKSESDQVHFRMGRGLVFHIAPSNVPTNFAYSLIFGLLAGNANVVRVSQKPYPQVKIICQALEELLEDATYESIRQMITIVRYEHHDALTQFFMGEAEAVMVWGGNATIQAMRRYEVKPRCQQLFFADRYSLAVMSEKQVAALSQDELKALVKAFYNDTYQMDQNGCSSPRLVVWTEKTLKGKERFWQALKEEVEADYKMPPIIAIDKYTRLCEDLITVESIERVSEKDALLMRIQLKTLPLEMEKLRGNAGYFYEYEISQLEELGKIISSSYQTLTYFGIAPEIFKMLIKQQHLLGIDRIVPVGKALEMAMIWDGYHLVHELSRIISL